MKVEGDTQERGSGLGLGDRNGNRGKDRIKVHHMIDENVIMMPGFFL
jgi:hypothetical protein